MEPPKHPALLAPFVLFGLSSALLGFGLGALFLFRIHWSLGPAAERWLELHGQLQIFGFLVPLVVGFATFVLPRLVAVPLRRVWAAKASLLFLASGTMLNLASAFGLIDKAWGWRMAVGLLLGLGLVTAAVALAGPIREVRALSREGGRPGYELFLLAALFFLAATGVVHAAGLWLGPGETDTGALRHGFATASWRLAIDGFAVGMALGVSARMFSGFLGIDPRLAYPNSVSSRPSLPSRDRQFWQLTWCWVVSVLAAASGRAFAVWPVVWAADTLFALAAVPLAFRLGLARTEGGPAVDTRQDPHFALGARAAYACLVAAAVVGAGAAVAAALGFSVHGWWEDARRHLLTLGFLMTLIATMAGRLAPGYAGRPFALPKLRLVAIVAFPLAASLRALEAVSGQWGPPKLMWLSGASGVVGVVGFLSLGAGLVATLLGARTKAHRKPV